MRQKKFVGLLLGLIFSSVTFTVFAADTVAKEETTSPPAVGALTADQVQPINSAQAPKQTTQPAPQMPMHQAPMQQAPETTAPMTTTPEQNESMAPATSGEAPATSSVPSQNTPSSTSPASTQTAPNATQSQ